MFSTDIVYTHFVGAGKKQWAVCMRTPPGKTLLDAGVGGWVAYSVAPEIDIGSFLHLVMKENANAAIRQSGGSGSFITGLWKHFDEANEAMIGMAVATVP